MRPVAALIAASVTLSGCALKGDVRRVEQQLQELRDETARADSARAVELARIHRTLDAVQDTLAAQQGLSVRSRAAIRGDLTEIQRQLVQIQELTGQSQQRLTELRSQLERRDRVAAVTPAGTPADSAAAALGLPPAEELYELSLSQLRRGSPAAARAGFRQLLEAYPEHGRAADALFFVGESWGASAPDSATVAYQAIIDRFPNSARAPSALYKLGLLAEQGGDPAAARVYYERVLAGYPRSEEAALARAKLNSGQ